MTDPISDMLTRIRNSSKVSKKEVFLPFSKVKLEVAKVLEKENWIKRVEVINPEEEKNSFKQIKITLRYNKDGSSVITRLKRVSRPGCRIYVKKDKIPVVLDGFGINILSTPQGLMTNQEARKNNLGGEIICEIY